MLCISGFLGIASSCEGEQSFKETKSYPAVGACVTIDWQGAGDTTGRERFENSASL